MASSCFLFLSGRFPSNRGFAISVHGMGANIGDALGPVVAGTLMMVGLAVYCNR